MAVRLAASRQEILQRYVDEYFSETGRETATTKDIAVWALQTERWVPPADLVLKQCREEFAKAMREQYIHDDHGRPVRAKHVARKREGNRQLYLYLSIMRTGL